MSKYFPQITQKHHTRQVHRPFNRKEAKQYWRKIITPTKEKGYLQLDLADFRKYKSPQNRHVQYAFFIIDIYSRYLWIIPLTSRKDLHKAFSQWYTKNNGSKWIKTITSDREFMSNKLLDFFKQHNIKTYFNYTADKHNTAIVERSIKTMRRIIKFYTSYNNTHKYINALQELVDLYNNTVHKTTGKTPAQVFKKGSKSKEVLQKYIKPLKIGAHVRVLNHKDVFRKEDEARWSSEIYEVVRPYKYRYYVKNIDTGKELAKAYARHQLQVIPKDTIRPQRKAPAPAPRPEPTPEPTPEPIDEIEQLEESRPIEELGHDKELAQIQRKSRFRRRMRKTGLAPVQSPKTGKRVKAVSKAKYQKFDHWTTRYDPIKKKAYDEYDVILLETKRSGNIKVIAPNFDEVDKRTKKRFPSIFQIPTSKLRERKKFIGRHHPKMGIEARKYLDGIGYFKDSSESDVPSDSESSSDLEIINV